MFPNTSCEAFVLLRTPKSVHLDTFCITYPTCSDGSTGWPSTLRKPANVYTRLSGSNKQLTVSPLSLRLLTRQKLGVSTGTVFHEVLRPVYTAAMRDILAENQRALESLQTPCSKWCFAVAF